MFKKYLLILSFFFCINAGAQPPSLVINSYYEVQNISTNSVAVNTVAGLHGGLKVLIIQMKGATINTSNTTLYGNITAYNGAGNYEFAEIESISGVTVKFKTPLCRQYELDGVIQLVTVPVYVGGITFVASLTCDPWNGKTGGVLVFEATGQLILQSGADVSGKGFRGGATGGGFWCNSNQYAEGGTAAGQKGEGIAAYVPAQEIGGGHLANGGGGSFGGNSGGGGGANFGNGGIGGKG